MPKNVRDLGKIIVAKGFKKMPKVQKSPNLVTLLVSDTGIRTHDLLDMSILPYPLDQGTRLRLSIFDLFLIFRTVRFNLFLTKSTFPSLGFDPKVSTKQKVFNSTGERNS